MTINQTKWQKNEMAKIMWNSKSHREFKFSRLLNLIPFLLYFYFNHISFNMFVFNHPKNHWNKNNINHIGYIIIFTFEFFFNFIATIIFGNILSSDIIIKIWSDQSLKKKINKLNLSIQIEKKCVEIIIFAEMSSLTALDNH